jgi:hypothetical protein
MNNISTAGRLELVKQVRETYNRNMYDMSDRERILYGAKKGKQNDMQDNLQKETVPASGGLFGIRLLAAVCIFLMIMIMDSKHISISGMSANDVYEAISWDYTTCFEEWANDLQALW